jgi:hypothetical protein
VGPGEWAKRRMALLLKPVKCISLLASLPTTTQHPRPPATERAPPAAVLAHVWFFGLWFRGSDAFGSCGYPTHGPPVEDIDFGDFLDQTCSQDPHSKHRRVNDTSPGKLRTQQSSQMMSLGAAFIFGCNLLRHLLCFKVFYYMLNPLF